MAYSLTFYDFNTRGSLSAAADQRWLILFSLGVNIALVRKKQSIPHHRDAPVLPRKPPARTTWQRCPWCKTWVNSSNQRLHTKFRHPERAVPDSLPTPKPPKAKHRKVKGCDYFAEPLPPPPSNYEPGDIYKFRKKLPGSYGKNQ